jgi:hypothetical protein
MVTVAHIVEKIIEEKPFIQEALSRGLINNSALAEELIPFVEKELNKKVKFSAVNMAIRRLSEKLNKKYNIKTKFDKSCDITIKSGLIAFSFYKTKEVQIYIKEIYNSVDFRSGDFLTITQGLNEVLVITNKKYSERIIDIVPKGSLKNTLKNLSSLTIRIPDSSVETPGLFYLATRAFASENINIIDIVSTINEMTYIVREKDTSRAFNVLNETINRHS